jgi:tetratricopeptide (TPR) repeat protein
MIAMFAISVPASATDTIDEATLFVQERTEAIEVENKTVDDAAAQATDLETVDLTETDAVDEGDVLRAQQLIRINRVDGFDESRHSQALELRSDAIDTDPDNIRVQVNLVDLYLTRARSLEKGSELNVENLKLALKWLESLTAVDRFTRMEQVIAMPQLVDVYVKLGEDAKAKRAVDDASSKVLAIAKLNPEIYEIWLSMVQCAIAVKDYERANDVIRAGYQSVKTQEVRRRIMQLASLVYLRNADDFKDISKEENFRNRLYALCKAISTNPRDVKIYDRLFEYLDVDQDAENHDVWLRNSILDCPIPGVVHILIGARAMLRDQINEGRNHWEIAQHQFSTTEFVTHRLLSIAIRKDPKCGEGELLDTAILLFPDQYMLYETRGAIKKREAILLLEQQDEVGARAKSESAIEDFKIVVEKVPDLITVHKHLMDCYEQIGDTDSTTIHASRVQDALDKVDEKQRKLYQKVLDDL